MYVLIIGMGEVGRHVVRTLEWDRHDIVAIDNDPAAIRLIEENHDVMTLQGYGASQDLLKKARAAEADLVVACTNHDEVNLIAALAARRMGARRVIARVQSNQWSGADENPGVSYGLLGVDVVFNPRILLAQELAKIAQSHGALEVIDVASSRIEVVQMEIGTTSRMLQRTLQNLGLPKGVLIGAIVRDGELRVPGGGDVLRPQDRIYLVGTPKEIVQAEDLFTTRREAHRVCIVGGGVVGAALARTLDRSGTTVMIIEKDRARAEELAANLPRATVVHGDGTDLSLLEEEGVGSYDLLAAVSHEDEVNLMAGLLAKRQGVGRVATLVHRPDYIAIYRQLGIDVALSPRTVASDHILRFCRQRDLQSLTLLEEGKAEILEIIARPEARVVGVPVRQMGVPRGALLCAIIRGEDVVVPSGDDTIAAGDTVVVLTTPDARAAVARMFRQRSL
ncbi:MAG: trk system potassium uptake protein TrkA [Myxococcota bacterium]|jgi:trk system potassium uptake protein TrkA